MKLAQKLATGYIRAKLHILTIVSAKQAAKKALDIFCTPMVHATKKLPAIFEKGEPLSFRLHGHTVRGHRWPAHKGGKTILILHGFESSVKKFDRYISILHKKGLGVLAFDAPAHGESGGKRINLPLYIEMIRHICEIYGPVDGFIAHSLADWR